MGLNEFLDTVPNEEGSQFTYAGLSELSGLSTDEALDLAEAWEDFGMMVVAVADIALNGDKAHACLNQPPC